MNYFKILGINFLVVFFANHILPGIEVTNLTKLPHLGGDLSFAFVLALLNSIIYMGIKTLHGHATGLKIAIVCLILNFAAYAIVKLIPIGIHVRTVEGYILVSVVVAVSSFLTNFFEMRRQDAANKSEPPV